MRVLIVGMAASTHLVRFVDLLSGSGHEVQVLDTALEAMPHPDLAADRVHVLALAGEAPPGCPVVVHEAADGDPVRSLDDVLRIVLATEPPDLVHAHETTAAGALVERVGRATGGLGVPWLLTNWGSDLYWFGRQPGYVPALRRIMTACPHLNAECHRDVALARAFGFRGNVVGVWPVAGGLDLDHAAGLRAPGPTSARRTVAIKGVSHGYGAALVGLEAVERCGDLLEGWELAGYQMDAAAQARATQVAADTGMAYRQLSDLQVRDSAHDDLLAMHGRARVSIGLNRSDGLSTSFLEAIAMGSFPVQGQASCGAELTAAGRGALFVPPDDPDAVTAALRRALTDDGLVDDAAARNTALTAELLDRRRIRARVLDAYERVVAGDHWAQAA